MSDGTLIPVTCEPPKSCKHICGGFTFTILCSAAYEIFSTADAGRTEFCVVLSNDYWTSLTVCLLIRCFLDRSLSFTEPASLNFLI